MKSREKERLREMQLAFIGKLMAGLSHEFVDSHTAWTNPFHQ